MSAPLLRRNVTFSMLKYVQNVFRRSKTKGTRKRAKEKQLLPDNINNTSRDGHRLEKSSSQDGFMPFRSMINSRYVQANRSILVQLNENADIHETLTRIQQAYGTFEKGFCYSDENRAKLVIVELANNRKLGGKASSRVKNWNDLEAVDACDKKLYRKIEEYIPKTLQLDLLNSCDSVSDQLLCLHKEMQMSEAMVRLHFFVGMLVKRTIKEAFSEAQAMFLGSSACGLAMEGKSDLDMVVLMDGVSHPNDLLKPLSAVIESCTGLFSNTEHIPFARVPIIKFNQVHTNMSCDLSCNVLTGVLMAETLHWLNAYEPMFYPLVMAVKIWGKEHHLTSQGMGFHFSNHMLTMLVLAYLQQKELLPALKTLYAKTDRGSKQLGTLSIWRDTELKKVKRNVHKIFINQEIGSLLQEFFQYYSNFSFHDHIIDIHFGKIIKRPHKFDICVLNPHERGHNMCKNVRAIQLDRFQTLCKHSAKLLEMYQEKTSDGSPWGLACVLSYDTLKQKKQGKLFDLDFDFSADDRHVQKISIVVGGDDAIDGDDAVDGDDLFAAGDTPVDFNTYRNSNLGSILMDKQHIELGVCGAGIGHIKESVNKLTESRIKNSGLEFNDSRKVKDNKSDENRKEITSKNRKKRKLKK